MPNSRPKIISLSNQKGGVGKTTTTINLAAALAELDLNVLVIDIDPQANATSGLGSFDEGLPRDVLDIMLGREKIEDCIVKTSFEGISIIRSQQDLNSADLELLTAANRTSILRTSLQSSDLSKYHFILIDCPPSLNLLTVNALVASHSVLVPLQSEFFALEGLSQLLLSIQDIRKTANPQLRIEGILLTMFDSRNRLAKQVEDDARENLGELVFETIIPRNVRVSEAPSYSEPVLSYDSNSKGSAAYRSLAQEILKRNQ